MLRIDPIRYRDDVVSTDCDVVHEIISSAGVFSPAETMIAVELVEERLAKGICSGYHFLFAEYLDSVVGYTCFGPIPATSGSYDLFWIAVRDRCRRRGLGKELLARTESSIQRLGGRRIYIETSSRSRYASTRSFYTSCGYQPQATLADYYGPGDAKIIYAKVINGSAHEPAITPPTRSRYRSCV